MKPDITTFEQVKLLIDEFYNKAINDEVLAPKFIHINLPEHLPRMYAFWAQVLLEQYGYTGNVFDKHVNLGLEEAHFTRWLLLFNEAVDKNFEGEKAELAKQRALSIGEIFKSKLEWMKKNS